MAYIDATGAVVTKFPEHIMIWGVSGNWLVRFQNQKTARYGFADGATGEIVVPARFSQVGGFGEIGLAYATEDGQARYIQSDGVA